ncbi:hypothetical protein SI859A1_02274 [Aurantimonas manganoxydans SI85-9A1]|uniref:Uncharacterized protein n=1 Tax=Aurantimonas manganoxydans (strain ATCC BAA-1229 / DSM 21871 / SI85-9A1) TaxID=287752 RepID=Q1YMC3_AURMS|nr:hypothetical protein SI859A1_02274 [Aurantimonas manganoxydans SI85-9A1]
MYDLNDRPVEGQGGNGNSLGSETNEVEICDNSAKPSAVSRISWAFARYSPSDVAMERSIAAVTWLDFPANMLRTSALALGGSISYRDWSWTKP